MAIMFHRPINGVIDRFAQSTDGRAELGPIKIQLGAPVLPPQYRPTVAEPASEIIDLSANIGKIGDTGPEGTTVGFSVAYAIQAKSYSEGRRDLVVSPRGIYTLAKRHDEYPGEDYEGTSLLGALRAGRTLGVYLEKDWPYSLKAPPPASVKPAFKLQGFTQTKTVSQVLDALRSGQVVVASVSVTSDFDSPSKDGKVVLKLPLTTIGLKTIAIVGYETKSAEFKFANDWGTGWGANGFGRIKDSDLTKIMQDGYTVEL
jgi:hypothetical protein